MRCHIILCAADFKRFIRENTFKLIVCSIITAIALIIGIYNAINFVDFVKFYEEKGNAIISYLRNESSALGIIFVFLIENALFSVVIWLCSYSDFTAFIAFAVLPVKAYKNIFIDLMILRYCGVFAIIFLILHLIILLSQLFTLFCMCAINFNSSLRYKFCFSEMYETIKSFVPSLIVLAILSVLESLFVVVGGLFI